MIDLINAGLGGSGAVVVAVGGSVRSDQSSVVAAAREAFFLAMTFLGAVAADPVGLVDGTVLSGAIAGAAVVGSVATVGAVVAIAGGRGASLLAAVAEVFKFKIECVNFFVQCVVVRSGIGCDRRSRCGRSRVGVDGGRGQCWFSGWFLDTFELACGLESFIESGWSSFEEFITERRTEVGDEEVESHVIKGCSGSVRDEGLSGVGTDVHTDGHEVGHSQKFCRPNRIRECEVAAGKGFEVVDGLNDTWVKGDDRFGLTLMEVGEVNGCRTRSTGCAEGFEKSRLEGVPVVTVDATAFERVEPFQRVSPKGVEDEGHRLRGRPVGGRTRAGNTFNPLLGGELIFSVTGVERQLS